MPPPLVQAKPTFVPQPDATYVNPVGIVATVWLSSFQYGATRISASAPST